MSDIHLYSNYSCFMVVYPQLSSSFLAYGAIVVRHSLVEAINCSIKSEQHLSFESSRFSATLTQRCTHLVGTTLCKLLLQNRTHTVILLMGTELIILGGNLEAKYISMIDL